jgi:hypothetical protein
MKDKIDLLDEAHNKITVKILDNIKYGETIILNQRFSLYKYYDMDYIVLRDSKYDDETFAVQYECKDEIVLTDFYGYDDNEDFNSIK